MMNNTIKQKTACYRQAAERVICNYEGVLQAFLLAAIAHCFNQEVAGT